MECVIGTKASMLLQFIDGLRGDVRITFEEGTWAAWLYDLLKPHVSEVVVCNPRKNALLKDGSKSDRIDARKLAELLCRQWTNRSLAFRIQRLRRQKPTTAIVEIPVCRVVDYDRVRPIPEAKR